MSIVEQIAHLEALADIDQEIRPRIKALELENRRLRSEVTDSLEKLDTRGRAITDLLAELAKKSQRHEHVTASQDTEQRADERRSESIDQPHSGEKDRYTRLLVGTVDGQELRFPLFKNRLTIGRSAQNDIQLKAAFVSRRHAVLVTDQDTARVIDWGSKNGVYVNSSRITEHFLDNNDVVTVGIVNFRYEERPKREN